jgi:hypothetical protein
MPVLAPRAEPLRQQAAGSSAGERFLGGCHGRRAGIERHELHSRLEPIIPDPFTHGQRHMIGAGRSS